MTRRWCGGASLGLTAGMGGDCSHQAGDEPVATLPCVRENKVTWMTVGSSVPQGDCRDLMLDVVGEGEEGYLVSFLLSISRRLGEGLQRPSPSHS